MIFISALESHGKHSCYMAASKRKVVTVAGDDRTNSPVPIRKKKREGKGVNRLITCLRVMVPKSPGHDTKHIMESARRRKGPIYVDAKSARLPVLSNFISKVRSQGHLRALAIRSRLCPGTLIHLAHAYFRYFESTDQ